MASLCNGSRQYLHSGYFDFRDAFQTVLDSYCCDIADNERNGYFTFQTIIVPQSEKTGLIAHVSRFNFSPRTQSYMNKLSNSTFKIS